MNSKCPAPHHVLEAHVEKKIQKIEDNLKVDFNSCETIMKKMNLEMLKGLSKDTNPTAKVKMIPSYVTHLPDGSERGSFLALDLGGTNFRVLHVKLDDESNIEMDSQIYKMPESVITGDGDKLFDHIAACMADFLNRLGLKDSVLPVGFTFSFPCKQDSLDSATLITWTKGFTAKGVVGKNIVTMLKDAIKRRGDIQCNVVAVVNDTVGTLMSCAHTNPNCQIGLIIGTGSNACYMEDSQNVELISQKEGQMCINMEWGAFGDDGALDDFRNEYDRLVDETSMNIGRQLFEKMISGMYLGEIVRLVLCDLTKSGVLFNGKLSPALSTSGKFETSFVSQIEGPSRLNTNMNETHTNNYASDMTATQNVLASLNILEANRADCEIVTRVCQAVSKRAAHLCASGIAAIAHKIAENERSNGRIKPDEVCKLTVGVDGTVYKKHPTFATMMTKMTDDLCRSKNIKVECTLSYDGSGKGAALVTAVADRMIKEKSFSS